MASLSDSTPDSNPIEILRAFPDAGLCHGFLGRSGGVSRGPFASLNLAYHVGDDRACVDSNWDRLRRAIPALRAVALMNQVHGTEIHVVTGANASGRPRGDGIVTAEPGVTLGIFTADCVPILMIDPKRKIAGAFHAGWRGIVAGIAPGAVAAMLNLGARVSDLRAALGPSIGPCCFEVGEDVSDRFRAEIPAAQNHIRAGHQGKSYLDLRAIVTNQLCEAGLLSTNIKKAGECTLCYSSRFFSRRAAGGNTTGLQLSFVGFTR